MFSLPQFIFGQYEVGIEVGMAANQSFELCEPRINSTLNCEAPYTNSPLAFFFIGIMLLVLELPFCTLLVLLMLMILHIQNIRLYTWEYFMAVLLLDMPLDLQLEVYSC